MNCKNKHFIGSIIIMMSFGLLFFCDSVSGEPLRLSKKEETKFNVGTYSDYVRTKRKKKFIPHNYLSISDIKRKGIPLQVYETNGYIVDIYTCPACPEGAMCKPCMKRHIVISEELTEFDFSSLMDKQMIVFVDEKTKFKKGVRYRFVIRMLDVKTTDQSINNVDLIYAKRIK